MSKYRLSVLLYLLIASSLVVAERRPLRHALDQIFDAVLDVVAPVSEVLGDSPCRRQGLLYRQAIKEGHHWALRMLDAGAKIPSGLLLHNTLQMGNFDECLAVRHTDPALGELEGQHCQVSVGVENCVSALSCVDKSEFGILNITFLDRFYSLLEEREVSAAIQMMGASWALCVPAACSASELQLHLRAALPALSLRVDEQACTSRADAVPVWDWDSMFALFLLSMLFAMVVAGTVYDLAIGDKSGRPRLMAFSLINNGRLLFTSNNTINSEHLTSLHGIRCLAMLSIVYAHCCLFNMFSPLENYLEALNDLCQRWSLMPFINATLHVDTFFVMSGTLMAYSYIRQRERGVKFSLRKFYLNRYIRFAPGQNFTQVLGVVALPLGVSALNGPMAKANIAAIATECKNMHWLNMIYVTNFLDEGHLCQTMAWTLSIEMQLLLVSPLLLYPLWRRPRLGMALLALLSVLATVNVFSIAYKHRLHVVSPIQETRYSLNLGHVYYYPHTRCVPWLIGLAIGALLARRVAPSRRQAALGWCLSAALGYYSMFHAHESFQFNYVPHRLHSAIYFALMRPSWALACAWMIFACETGFGGFVHDLLGWQGWQFPSRLCFGVFLQHLTFASALTVQSKTTIHYSELPGIIEFWGVVVLSVIAAIALHLAVEMPFYILCSTYQSKSTDKKQPKKDCISP